MQNAYAVKLLAAKRALKDEERAFIVHHCIKTFYQVSAVALNEKFGFGEGRIVIFREAVDAIFREYGGLQKMNDVDYADAKLEERYKKIMGHDDGF